MIKIEGEQELFSRVAQAAYEYLNLSGNVIVETDIIDAEEMQSLNLKTRGIDAVTDVLSFPFIEKIDIFDNMHYPYNYDAVSDGVRIGSIVICAQRADSQAEQYGHSKEREYAYLFTHGLLHLLGYDHLSDEEEQAMTAAAENILKAVNITRG